MSNRNLYDVRARIVEAARKGGRCVEDVHLIAVSKGRSINDILRLHETGIRDFAENRSHELEEKANRQELQGIQWHFIGELQSRQCRVIAANSNVVHSVNRQKDALVLSQAIQGTNRALDIFLQVNLSGEVSKGGISCSRWEENHTQVDDLVALARNLVDLPCLAVAGLMTMAPVGLPNEDLRILFARTRFLLETLRSVEPRVGGALSMGMSGDFEVAIEEGATHVRLGRILFD